ncbi:hypothetical protein EZV62_005366 [Acer yangbiense]|uniref:Ribonuclease H1 N-terminal domain-containing protein n=1 Tax=Acer yangbiense TaxID=1000413 RepID=A0A5C7IME9_9ROSI|nr:hypothetical protein EZV62_005366 [Acer yangbiense]
MSKIISVSRETSYESLHDIVSRLVEANPNESSIKMKFIFNSPEVLAPFEVVNDDDVQVFLCDNSDVNTRTSLCVTVERKRRIIPNTQDPDNELVNEDIGNVFESDNGNGVGLDNIHESLLSPNDFQNVDVFFIGVDNDDEATDSRPSTSEFKVKKSTKTLLAMSCIVEDCKWRVRATKLKDCHSLGVYESWNECEAQINGFEGSFVKSYSVV